MIKVIMFYIKFTDEKHFNDHCLMLKLICTINIRQQIYEKKSYIHVHKNTVQYSRRHSSYSTYRNSQIHPQQIHFYTCIQIHQIYWSNQHFHDIWQFHQGIHLGLNINKRIRDIRYSNFIAFISIPLRHYTCTF